LYLRNHPDIAAPKEKEIHYFSMYYDKGIKFYQQFFPRKCLTKERSKISGEASVSYLSSCEAPHRIYETFPESKFIILLRDPVLNFFRFFFFFLSFFNFIINNK